MKKKIILPLILASLLIAVNSYAETYLSLYTGLAKPHDADITNNYGAGSGQTGQMSFKNNINYGAKFGFWLTGVDAPYLGFQIDGNFYNTDIREIVSSTGVVAPVTSNMDVYSVFANVLVRGTGDIKPYAGVGVGFLDMKIGQGQKPVPAVGIPGGWKGGSDSAFGWQVLAGVDYPLSPHTSLIVEYKYGNANFTFDSSTGVPLDIKYSASQFNAGISINF